jgi:hypothetical protein
MRASTFVPTVDALGQPGRKCLVVKLHNADSKPE